MKRIIWYLARFSDKKIYIVRVTKANDSERSHPRAGIPAPVWLSILVSIVTKFLIFLTTCKVILYIRVLLTP